MIRLSWVGNILAYPTLASLRNFAETITWLYYVTVYIVCIFMITKLSYKISTYSIISRKKDEN